MLLKLAKATIVLSATAFIMPAEHFGSMPGLGDDAPEAFAQHGTRAIATLTSAAGNTCENEPALCDRLNNAATDAQTAITSSVNATVRQISVDDAIARQIALEAAKGLASNL